MRHAFAIWFVLCLSSMGVAEDWPQWRGPLGTGISAETAAPLEWSLEKNIAWQVDLRGPGNSTPIVWKDKLFVTCVSNEGRTRGTYAFDARSGDALWSMTVEYTDPEPTHATNPPCSASPVTDGERVIVWHGSAGLYCYDLAGKELWRKSLGKFEHIWGNAGSPVIYKDLVILNAGPGLKVAIVALNKRTGEEVWSQSFPGMQSEKLDEFRGSWSTPVLHREHDRDVMLLQLPEKLRAVDPTSGEEIWSCAGPSKLFYTSPLIAGEVIVAMCGYGGPAMGVRGGGSGDVTETHRLWLQTEKIPQRVGSGVVVAGKVYILNEDGIAWCLDATSGEIHWKHRLGGSAWSSALAVAGRVYLTDQTGVTYVIEPNAEECKLLATNPLDGSTMRASPAISNGRIFLRTYKTLYCAAAK